MCYRYVLQKEALDALSARLAVPVAVGWQSRYNLAPGASVPVVRARAGGEGPPLEVASLRWGLLPAWTKEPATATAPANARAEGLAGRSLFRDAFRRRRCVVPASGFYEWRGEGGRRQPYLCRMLHGAPLCFAGLWETWSGPMAGPVVETCAIITVPPNEAIRPIHDRMPAILESGDVLRWLDPRLTESRDLAPLLRPFSGEAMSVVRVTTRVNSTRFDDPSCLEPAPAGGDSGDSGQLSLEI